MSAPCSLPFPSSGVDPPRRRHPSGAGQPIHAVPEALGLRDLIRDGFREDGDSPRQKPQNLDQPPPTAARCSTVVRDPFGGGAMPEYRGVRYELEWKGPWDWRMFPDENQVTPACQGTLECTGHTDPYRAVAEATVHTVIDEMLERGLFEAPNAKTDGAQQQRGGWAQ